MNRQGHESSKFFTGIEIEHTPAHGKKTLFVVGLQSVEEINDWLEDLNSYEDSLGQVDHIYFGANMSFPNFAFDDAVGWESWERMITPFLKKDLFCSLDLDVKSVEGLLEGSLCEFINFIPVISVKLPYLQQLGYNATIKLDDKDFRATNPGVWCHRLHDLVNPQNFTHWNEYKKDSVL